MKQPVPQWRVYERFVAQLQSSKASDEITVVPNARLLGAISGVERQIDVLIDARLQEDVSRRVIVDAKFRHRKLDVKDVEAFEGMMRDCRAHRGILVCANGYTPAAKRRAQDTIAITLVRPDELDSFDPTAWEPCLGRCNDGKRRARSEGWVLYDQPFGVSIGDSPLSVMVVGKCDACHDFHVWCWECGSRFALVGDEAEFKCDCDRFWITTIEEEGTDQLRNELSAVLLLLVESAAPLQPLVVDRRPMR
jgi:restriction endonuclease